MRILLVNRFYGGDQVPTGRMLHDVACVLQQGGHEVHVLTSRNTYASKTDTDVTCPTEITVHHVWIDAGSLQAVSWFAFWLQACLYIPWMRWDRCLILTDPPFMVFVAWLTHLLGRQRRKLYWWTMDLYPEALCADGLLKSGSLWWRVLEQMNDLGIRALAGVICLGERQRQHLQRYPQWQTRPDFCIVVPPWDYRPLPHVSPIDNQFLAQHHWQQKNIVLYAGNLGRAHTYTDILAAARELTRRGDTQWQFVFVCRGVLRSVLEAESADLENITVLDYVPPGQTADLLWSSAVHLITMADGWQGIVVPSKLYGVLQTEAPVLFIGPQDADTADQIKYYNAGEVLPNGCGTEAIIDALVRLCPPRYRRVQSLDLYGAHHIANFVTQA